MTAENIPKQEGFSAVIEVGGQIGSFVKVAKTTDIPAGTMKHVEVDGLEILIANVEGRFYAVGDRCPHLNATLSEGTLNKTIVTCPRHLSTFDVTTGRAISGTRSSLSTYEVKVVGDDLFIDIQ
ncbi:MAG: non-heme iron oxygenase ferredoxin subunit [Candidatus Bathyarchaeia archaeon]|jgi:nitrite reductase/ring-hydroxylating ferredoxin subunit